MDSPFVLDVHCALHHHVQRGAFMQQATFSELRNHAKQYFDIVEAGEAVRIVRNGKPIADIVPIPQDLPSWKRRAAQPLLVNGVSVSKIIIEERDTVL
ncbi:MAG: type II toxin-antitoxin system prevent-host-death family antitoxin [Trichlorobacter sp.]|jgi:prevent-host-death family protein|nr:type II toxin-antitoxin system prevent-host-death family antitoxin [Trichlorobacter sp.]